jgi:trk system potassium uptake protein
MKKQFLVIGVGRFGTALASHLYGLGHEVVAVDVSEARIEGVMHRVTHAVVADTTEEATLRNLGVSNFDAVVIAIGEDFKATVLTTVLAKDLGAKHVISKAGDALAAEVLTKVGADQVILPEHDSGTRLAGKLASPSMLGGFDLGTTHGVVEVEAPASLRGSLRKLDLSNRFGVQVIAINRGGEIEVAPRADVEVKSGDQLVLLGSHGAIEKLRRYLSG